MNCGDGDGAGGEVADSSTTMENCSWPRILVAACSSSAAIAIVISRN